MATIKQEMAAKEMIKVMQGKENKNKKQILKSVGYGRLSRHPKRILESKGYLEVLDKYLPDDKLAKKHKQFLNSEKEEIGIKALDLSYKVKGSYAPEKKQAVNLNLNTELKNSKQSRELIEEYEEKIRQMLKSKEKM